MERNLRIAAPVAGGAAVISLLVGLIAGVPIGTALLRGILSAVAFGGLAVGAAVIARSQLPGIDGAPEPASAVSVKPSSQEGPSDGQESGSRLNIVVEDESSDTSEAESPAERPKRTGVGDDEASVSEDTGGDAVAASSGDDAEHDTDAADTEELVDEVEESAAEDETAVMNAAISEEQDGTAVEIDDTMLDEMPDIGSFAGSFVSGDSAEGDEAHDATGPGTDDGGSDGAKQKKGDPRKGFDNKTIAKALQTFMAQDSE
jgi:hypothetical protein